MMRKLSMPTKSLRLTLLCCGLINFVPSLLQAPEQPPAKQPISGRQRRKRAHKTTTRKEITSLPYVVAGLGSTTFVVALINWLCKTPTMPKCCTPIVNYIPTQSHQGSRPAEAWPSVVRPMDPTQRSVQAAAAFAHHEKQTKKAPAKADKIGQETPAERELLQLLQATEEEIYYADEAYQYCVKHFGCKPAAKIVEEVKNTRLPQDLQELILKLKDI